MFERIVIRLSCYVVAGAMPFLSPAITAAENPVDNTKVELVSEKDAVVPDREFWMGIRIDLQEGWHTYWVNPGDAGEAPRIDWRLPAGFQASAIQWPYPVRIATPPFADYGYEHQVLLLVALRPPPGLKAGENENIAANVHYLVCREVCTPGKKEVSLSLPVRNSAAPGSDLPLFQATRLRLPKPVPASWKFTVISLAHEFQLSLRGAKLPAAPEFFPLVAEQIENAAPQTTTPIRGGVCVHLKKSKHLLKPIPRLDGVIVVAGTAYQVNVPVSQSSAHQGP